MRKIIGTCVLLFMIVFGASAAPSGEGERGKLKYTVAVAAEYPIVGVESIDGRLRDWLGEHIGDMVDSFDGIVVDPMLVDGSVEIGVDFTVSRPSGRAMSVVFETYSFPSGAAHPMTRVDVVSFDMESGRMLGLDDIFADAGRAVRIMSAGAKAAVEREMVKKAPEFGKEDEVWFDDGFKARRRNYSALVLEPGGVRVIFQKYQVLPYVFGMPEAFFSLEELEEAGPRRELWE